MLVQFKIKNFGPFRNEAVFDMRAIKSYKEHPYNLIQESEKASFLKVAAVYGANASGKSNFVDAYSAFLNIVKRSFSGKNKEDGESVLSANYNPFLFNESSAAAETEFEGTFHLNKTEYRFGFSYDATNIHYEWLYRKSLDTGRQTTILERSPDQLVLGASVRASCEKYVSDIDKDVLALSFFSSLKLRTHVFRDTLECIALILPLRLTCDRNIERMLDLYFRRDFNEKEKSRLLSFLSAIDIGIKNVEVDKSHEHVQVYTFHADEEGEMVKVPFEIESDGTRKLIAVYSFVSIAIAFNKGLIADELNMQLHPLLLKYIVDLFYKTDTQGQLIYTTHDTILLDKRFMRRDQVWFTDKNELGESTLYSMAEFKTRNDGSFEKEYLGGMFGGIPILKDYSL